MGGVRSHVAASDCSADIGRGQFYRAIGEAIGAIASVSPAGDLDGDGLDDLAVSVVGSNPIPGGGDGGRVIVAFGKPDRFDLVLGAGQRTSATIEPPADAGSFGAVAVGLGDADGDRVPDLAIAAPATGAISMDPLAPSPLHIQIGAPLARGVVFLVSGRLLHRNETVALDRTPDGWFRVDGPPGTQRLGIALAEAGDQNGDGLADLLIGQLPGRSAFSNSDARPARG